MRVRRSALEAHLLQWQKEEMKRRVMGATEIAIYICVPTGHAEPAPLFWPEEDGFVPPETLLLNQGIQRTKGACDLKLHIPYARPTRGKTYLSVSNLFCP